MPAPLFVQKEMFFVTATRLLYSNVSNYLACNVFCNTQVGTNKKYQKSLRVTLLQKNKILLV